MKRNHRHVFEHIVETGSCMAETCKDIHIFLVHRCVICGIRSNGERIEWKGYKY